MLLEALVACAGVTLRAVATSIGMDLRDGKVLAEGDLDFRGTLGVSKEAPVGFVLRTYSHGDKKMNNDRMRASSVAIVIALVSGFACTAVHGQTVQGTPADEQAIKDLVALHASASQRDDLEGLVVGLQADADSRRADGRILSGRAEIEQSYRDVISGGPKRMAHAHPPETIRIRFLQADVAFVDVESASVAGPGPRTPFFLVFTKIQGKWGVAVERRGVPLK